MLKRLPEDIQKKVYDFIDYKPLKICIYRDLMDKWIYINRRQFKNIIKEMIEQNNIDNLNQESLYEKIVIGDMDWLDYFFQIKYKKGQQYGIYEAYIYMSLESDNSWYFNSKNFNMIGPYYWFDIILGNKDTKESIDLNEFDLYNLSSTFLFK